MERERNAEAVASALDAAEAASPVEAVESVTRELGLALGARSVSFLIADLSGRGLVRLAHVPLTEGGDESREHPPWSRSAHTDKYDPASSPLAARQALTPNEPTRDDVPGQV